MKIKKNNNLLIIILLILLNIIFLLLGNYSIYETLEAKQKSIKFNIKKDIVVKPIDSSLNTVDPDAANKNIKDKKADKQKSNMIKTLS
tara:strand:+ start:1130 stop:1393 length:264 start_codon:yes stop_codon:yes gene_type:complete